MAIKRKQICKVCGKKLWLKEFYKESDTTYKKVCKECHKKYVNERYAISHKKPNGKYYHSSYGRVMEHNGMALKIFWNKDMLDILHKYYPNTKNEEVADRCGVSQRTMIRKARELGLRKNKDFIHEVCCDNLKLAVLSRKIQSYKGKQDIAI